MPELREVYDMVTRQRPPAPGALERQRERQHMYLRNRKLGAIALSAALAVVAALFVVDGFAATNQGKEPNKVAGLPATLPSKPGVYLFDLETKQVTGVAGVFNVAPPANPNDVPAGIAVSPDGTMVAYEGAATGGKQVIFVANINGTNIRALEKTAGPSPDPVGPRFSPDGSQIVYQARPFGGLANYVGDLFLVNVATGETTRLTRLARVISDLWYMGPTFSPDGETVFFTRPSSNWANQSWNLWSVPASGGRPRLVLRDAVGGRLSPDGRTIVYFKYKPSPENPFFGDIWLADSDGTNARRVASGDVFSARWSPDGTKIAYHYHYSDQGPGVAYVLDVATGEISTVLEDTNAFPEWVDDHTWIIGVD
jgi:Tol biopolymer transport system component